LRISWRRWTTEADRPPRPTPFFATSEEWRADSAAYVLGGAISILAVLAALQNSWIVSEVVLVFFIAIVLSG
jgi:hypothetical protein